MNNQTTSKTEHKRNGQHSPSCRQHLNTD